MSINFLVSSLTGGLGMTIKDAKIVMQSSSCPNVLNIIRNKVST